MTQDQGEVIVRDLGSTNGIRINGQRVEIGRLRPGDELSIAHIRYRLDNGQGHEQTLADGPREARERERDREVAEMAAAGLGMPGPHSHAFAGPAAAVPSGLPGEHRMAAAVRDLLPSALAEHCRIQVIVQVPNEPGARGAGEPAEKLDACRPDSSP
jgi:hypothetical protein